MNLKRIAFTLLFTGIGLSFIFGGYARWNSANPAKTCASCHEISPSVSEWQFSAHRKIRCTECHGTALSNGIHSIKEKADMVFSNLGDKKEHEEIVMTEKQVLELSVRCTNCHQSEYAKWSSGGHSANYARIFLNEEHNRKEKPYWYCLRCHGMFYDGNIQDLMKSPVTANGKWALNEEGKGSDMTIPCLTCHQIHSDNEPLTETKITNNQQPLLSVKLNRNPSINWYIRTDKRSQRADKLKTIEMFDHGKSVKVSNDPANKLCMQCHSPNFVHQVGSEDDRTPTGVHEGISCIACHSPHSNDASNSCKTCHPAISNCKIDVTTMNTTYANIKSPNNIHSVSCSSCHADGRKLTSRTAPKAEKI